MRSCYIVLLVGLGVSSAIPVHAQFGRRGGDPFGFLAKKYDSNKDGKIEQKEYDRDAETFARLDKNKDGTLTAEDWHGRGFGRGRDRDRDSRDKSKAPTVGKVAPDFELTHILKPKKKLKLSEFAGKKPVALIFGSCT